MNHHTAHAEDSACSLLVLNKLEHNALELLRDTHRHAPFQAAELARAVDSLHAFLQVIAAARAQSQGGPLALLCSGHEPKGAFGQPLRDEDHQR
ncbi:hypothetical protein C5609_15705 [Pseudomonas putida]|uniref:hypothetical protein n=1 Tax=Pseudomonas putida TaxID=303 RepID=UPI00106FEACD|nr:hypothetical protein [Pseudomonas putida]TFF51033.1 hypothetical protein C5609_15705 [Pseudomonas putida]